MCIRDSGGFAFGLDRLVMLLCGASSLREVIAFPKTKDATCPLTQAPGPVSYTHLDVYKRQVFIPLGELVDVDKELARLDKERQGLEKEVARAEGKLNNPGFVNKAPEKIVAEEREKLALNQDKLERLDERIASLQEMR